MQRLEQKIAILCGITLGVMTIGIASMGLEHPAYAAIVAKAVLPKFVVNGCWYNGILEPIGTHADVWGVGCFYCIAPNQWAPSGC